MFAGGRRRTSNIRVMQLFHELKQQFPTVPDHIVTACIANYANRSIPEGGSDRDNFDFREVLEAAAALRSVEDQELMGRTLTKPADPTVSLSEPSLNQVPNVAELSKSSRVNPQNNNLTITSETRHTAGVQEKPTVTERRHRSEMNESDSDVNRNVVKPSAFYSKESESVSVNPAEKRPLAPQRPNHLNIKCETSSAFDKPTGETDPGGFNKIQPSERCFDLQKLLNTENLNVKPPRSPLSAKRFANANLKNSPTKSDQNLNIRSSPLASPENTRKTPLHHGSTDSVSASTSGISSGGVSNSSNTNFPPTSSSSGGPRRSDPSDRRPETAETPTQTTETLIGSGSVNLSLNVNCQLDLVQSPTVPKHTSVLQVTPQLPWCQEPMSQRSYTSVNLTLRPPSTEPQAPIDITSQNSSLTYSTSSFDSQKGLQSRLQITVGPGGGSVSSLRTRPRSSYHPHDTPEQTVPVRAGSLPDLASTESKSPVISKQQARIERLRIELITEKGRLIAMQEEVTSLEKPSLMASKVDAEIEKQLQKEIRHLRGQCERLTYDVDRQSESRVPLGETNEAFYRNIYTGQRGPFTLGSSSEQRAPSSPRHLHYQGPTSMPQIEVEGPKWNCHMCTFQNHPLLDKCEQCEMPRILHGTKSEPPNPCLAFGMVRPLGENGPYSPNQVFNNNINKQESNSLSPNSINSSSDLRSFNPLIRSDVRNGTILPINRLLTTQHSAGNSSSVL